MSSHGRGGILVVSDVDEPHVPVRASYRTVRSPALGELLHFMDGAVDARHGGSAGPSSASGAAMQLRRVLQRAVQDEVERWVIELGGLTAMDGATVLDCNEELGIVKLRVEDVEQWVDRLQKLIQGRVNI